jgi:hypothetical protein
MRKEELEDVVAYHLTIIRRKFVTHREVFFV